MLTIPNLISSYEEKFIVNKLPEVYSILNQAYKLAREDYGPISVWNLDSDRDVARAQIIDIFTLYMKGWVRCDNSTQKCVNSVVKDLLGKNTNAASTYNLILANTVKINFDDTGGFSSYLTMAECDEGCFVDTNNMANAHTIMVNVTGKSKNAMWGKDLFLFAILDRGILPYGDVGHGKWRCNPSLESPSGWWTGATCAGYVLKHKNLDYLKCRKGDTAYCNKSYFP